MAGRHNSAAEIGGWTSRELDPIEPESEDEATRTEVGSSSVARALLSIRRRLRDDWDDEDSLRNVETMPAPPQSDIRMIGGQRQEPDDCGASSKEDPFALYVEALREPAIELEPRTVPPPRQRKETVKLPTMRPRQDTLPMIDRPLASPPSPTSKSPLAKATPAAAIVRPPMGQPHAPDSAPPAPFRGAAPLFIGAFAVGILLSGIVVFVLSRL